MRWMAEQKEVIACRQAGHKSSGGAPYIFTLFAKTTISLARKCELH